jgi:cell fate regulator YaaT (PSP1 superfamily)
LEGKEREAMPMFRSLVEKHGLDMKPIDVEYVFDGDKILFYFAAEERVDFRELVKELASSFHARIDMRQVGVRDEARMVGGIGHCGQVLCCARLSGDFQPVSIRMAKEQDLPLNPLKISGVCGRLMCCLRYEFDAYKDYKSRAPKRGAMIETPGGPAKVTSHNTPRETVTMRLEDGSSVTVPLASMHCCKGTGCPCSVGQEAMDEAASAASPLVSMAAKIADLPASGAPEPAPKADRAEAQQPGGEPQGRRRRRRPKSGGAAEQGAAAAPKAAGAKQPAAPVQGAKDGADKAPKPARRRRRRRPGGGSKAQ